MLTVLKLMCERGYKKRITVPTENYFQLTNDGALFTYFIDHKMKFITFDTREELAEFMVEQGMIESFTGTGKNLKMYEKTIHSVAGKGGVPVLWTRTSLLEWEKVKFYPSDVIHFASQHEFELQGSMMGLVKAKVKAKVINMIG